MRVIEKVVYQFSELSEDAKECAAMIGLDIDKIYFSGFSSQGDGACFIGSYGYKKQALQSITRHAPEDEELIRIAEQLQKLQKQAFYGLKANTHHHGRYYHENSISIECEHINRYITYNEEEDLKELLRAFCRWVYKQLENDYDYQMSDSVIDENIISNAYEFDINGNIV